MMEASTESVIRYAALMVGGEMGTTEVDLYMQENPRSTNTQLFSFLALLKAYLPESYLLMSECQKILGPPDPIHGGPPFEVRMSPFIDLISTSNPDPGHVSVTDRETAVVILNLLGHLQITRSSIVNKIMFSLCGDQAKPYIIQYIKDMLLKRDKGEKCRNKFSWLIMDIKNETFNHAESVLETASKKFTNIPTFPQTLSRLYYNEEGQDEKKSKAKYWANEAIKRAPKNSYVADTLGQIYKNCLRRARQPQYVRAMTEQAFKAFKDVEEKAENEEGPEMKDIGALSTSKSFNNRGLFDFIQVAKIAFEKVVGAEKQSLINNKKMEVEEKFDFFEWYLIYSKPDVTTLEPHYFWKDVALCYKHYTGQTASESTSFPGLLDCLNQGLFLSKGKRAGLDGQKTVSELEEIQDVLKNLYEENPDDVSAAERYILANIVLSNKMPDSPRLASVTQLKSIIFRFLDTQVGRRSPEFYLLLVLLFWPEEQDQTLQTQDNKETQHQATHDDGSDDQSWEDSSSSTEEEQEAGGEAVQVPADLMFVPDLGQYVTFMKEAFERTYAKYLRGRHLLPLFLLGKGSGLSRWIHTSKLDAIVEEKVDIELAGEIHVHNIKKFKRINKMWKNGEAWQIQEIQDILLPVAVRPCHPPTAPHDKQAGFVCAGGTEVKLPTKESGLFYLGFTIQGPVFLP